MTTSRKVSVCIPVHNGERYLRETIESVTRQTAVDLEIIVGDDLSADASLGIAEDCAAEHPQHQWKILKSDIRLGMAGNWNACLQASTGEFIKVMGQDDLLYPGALAAQSEVLSSNPDVVLVVCGCDIISSGGKKIFKRPRTRGSGVYPGNELADDCLRKRANLIGEPVTVMARRSDFISLGGFSSAHRYYIDLEMWLRLLGIGDCAVLDDPQCAFRIHGKSVSSSTQRQDFNQFDDLPGAREHLASLTPAARMIRLAKAGISTRFRSAIYRIYG